MNIYGEKILTPYDESSVYTPYWRHQVAKVFTNNIGNTESIDYRVAGDEYIQPYVSYLLSGGNIKDSKYEMLISWYTGADTSIKTYLEPLLLADVPYDIIAKDLNIPEDIVVLYEKLFFNIRDNDGKLVPSTMLKMYFVRGSANVEPDHMDESTRSKYIAVSMGYDGLLRYWNWPIKEQGDNINTKLIEAIQGTTIKRIASESVNNFDLTAILRTLMEDKRDTMKLEIMKGELELKKRIADKEGVGEGSILDHPLVTILSAMAPKMVEMDLSQENVQLIEAKLRNKLAAQSNINAKQIEDKGADAAKSAFNKLIKQQSQKVQDNGGK